MAINFPSSPTTNQSYTFNGRTWTWNGIGWQATGSTGLTVYTKTNFTATAGQTSFSATYTVGFVDVYYNGSKLSTSEYTATSGTTVVLGTAAAVGDIIETIAWTISSSFNPSLGSASATSMAIGGATLGTNALAVTGTTQLNSALNYGGVTLSNSVTGTGSMVLSTSPTLTTPVLGAATGTSLALGGATLGSNALAVTGTSQFNAVVSAVNGRSVGDYQVLLEGGYNGYSAAVSLQSRTSSGGTLVEMGRISSDGEAAWNTTGATQNAYMRFYTTAAGTSTERMRIDSSGNLAVGTTTTNGYKVAIYSQLSLLCNSSASANMFIVYSAGTPGNAGWGGGNTICYVTKDTGTSRSISAAGTVNASGADYAEYMTKADDCGVIIKGGIAGVNDDGKLTDKFADAHSFVIKSTDPSYVGGDTWASEIEWLGPLKDGATDKEITAKKSYDDAVEAARQFVDRIAFSGQVPVNVTGATVGDYIVPVAGPDGGITGEAVTNPTFDQYRAAVGRVWKILEDGRAFVSVKVS